MAAIELDDNEQRILLTMAQRMFADLANGRMRLRDPETIARQAYVESLAFVKVTSQILSGDVQIAKPQTQEKPLFVMVHLWNMADTEKSIHGSPMNDPNGNPLYEIQPVDRYAFGPKLAKGHPVNQRFLGNAIRNTVRGQDGTPVPALCNQTGKPLSQAEIDELKEYAPDQGGAV